MTGGRDKTADGQYRTATVSTVGAFLESLPSRRSEFLYRGQANARWRVDCSAVRRLALDPAVDPARIGHSLVAYMARLLGGAARYIGTCPELPQGCSELEVLAQLQHQGAATGLIDFSTEPLVALWFACSGHPTEDGAVYLLSRADVRSTDELDVRRYGVVKYFYGAGARDVPCLWHPRAVRGRPASQESIFILGVPFLWPPLLGKLVIDNDSKPAVLEELRATHGIDESSLFADLAGYAYANAVSRPFDTDHAIRFWTERAAAYAKESPERAQGYVDCGLVYVETGQYEQAIERFTDATGADPANVGAYVNRAGAKFRLRDYDGALADYNAAIAQLEKTEGIDRQRIGRVYWDRGQTRMKLGQDEQGCADCNRAIEMGFKMWIKVEGEDAGSVTDRPELSGQYRSHPVIPRGDRIVG